MTCVEERERGDKHTLCKDAETELITMHMRIKALQRGFQALGTEFMGMGPLDKQGNILPPLKPGTRLIQQRLWDLQESISAVKCYIKVRPKSALANLPVEGLQGDAWLKSLLHQFRELRHLFRGLQEDVIVHTMTMVIYAGLDASRNVAFSQHYGNLFVAALQALWYGLLTWPDDPRAEGFRLKCCLRFKYYAKLDPMKRLIPDAGSLSEALLVDKIAALFRINLQRWDRTHNLNLPGTRRVLEVFAYDLPKKYAEGMYDIQALFTTTMIH